MCNIIISNQSLEFIVYNIVFSEISGKFTTDSIYNKLQENNISAEKNELKNLFEKWLECGLIFEDAKSYIVNVNFF